MKKQKGEIAKLQTRQEIIDNNKIEWNKYLESFIYVDENYPDSESGDKFKNFYSEKCIEIYDSYTLTRFVIKRREERYVYISKLRIDVHHNYADTKNNDDLASIYELF